MKIVLTGGGTGGHFYPLIAVAEDIQRIAREKKLVTPQLYFFGPQPYDPALLHDMGITFVGIRAGKRRAYFSVRNFFDFFVTLYGIVQALWNILTIFPDAIFTKGGFGSFPTVLAARFFRIPVVMHESDTIPGRVNAWTGKFAEKIAVSYPETARFFKADRVAVTGNPIRSAIRYAPKDGTGKEFFKLPLDQKVVLVLGGSQGARIINEVVLESLPDLVEEFVVIHQTGSLNYDDMTKRSKVVLYNNPKSAKYMPLASLDPLTLKMAAGAADIIISRAGSTLFEVAAWKTPAIVIPITESPGDHQKHNAYAFARSGAGIVIEENNLTHNVLTSEIRRIIGDSALYADMVKGCERFGGTEGATRIAEVLIAIGVSHES